MVAIRSWVSKGSIRYITRLIPTDTPTGASTGTPTGTPTGAWYSVGIAPGICRMPEHTKSFYGCTAAAAAVLRVLSSIIHTQDR